MNIAATMNVAELSNYVNNLELSSIYFKDLSGSNKTADTSNEDEAAADTSVDESDEEPSDEGRRLESYYDELLLEHADDLKFGFHYDSGVGTNELWLMLEFGNFGAVNIGENMDSLEVHIKNTSFIVSVATLKPLSDTALEKEFQMKVPPLEPAENEIYDQFLKFLVYFQYLVFVLQVIAYI